MVSEYVNTKNYSSVDKVKEIARMVGWDGTKDEMSRKFLSDLKILTTNYNDMPFKAMKTVVDDFIRDDKHKVLFLHIREPEEIERVRKLFNAKTVLILRDSVKHIKTNVADANVFEYKYNFTVENHGTMEELRSKAHNFLITVGVL